MSVMSYDNRQMKLNYKVQIQKLMDAMHAVLPLRSYLLFRDIQQVFENCDIFFFKIFCISTPKELFAFAFPNKKEE